MWFEAFARIENRSQRFCLTVRGSSTILIPFLKRAIPKLTSYLIP